MHLHFSFMLPTVIALLGSTNSAGPRDVVDGSDDDDPLSVISGGAVPDCAWPTVVSLYTDQGTRCSGVYIGGRVVLTAAHCIPTDFVITTQVCADDADCPDVSSLNGMVTLECTASGECRDSNLLITNGIVHAQFGSEYDHLVSLDGNLPRKSVQVLYCRQVANVPPDAMGVNPNDFGYCLLSEEPNLQAIPISTPCENQAELLPGTELMGIGFGNFVSETAHSGGTKRWATATLFRDDWASQTSVLHSGMMEVWTSEGGASASFATGDSGGPLFAHMSDNTWRVVGIAAISGAWVIPYYHIDWLLADPNISLEDVLPCHDATGAFVGGPSCGSTPISPAVPSGQWDRGSHACHTESVVQMSNLCASRLTRGASEPHLRASLPPESTDLDSSIPAAGCRVAEPAPPQSLFSLLLMCFLRRWRMS